jgi:hypothetical protein
MFSVNKKSEQFPKCFTWHDHNEIFPLDKIIFHTVDNLQPELKGAQV